tara:strand:- start:2309 stop:2755 length:447 start_codon:yes stop_codon:yes gene_type:complete
VQEFVDRLHAAARSTLLSGITEEARRVGDYSAPLDGYTPDTSEVRIKYKLASGVGDAANDEFDRWLNTTYVEPAANAAQQLQEALAARDRVFAAARAEIVNLDKARANGTIYTYGNIQERLRAALTPPTETTTTTALAEAHDTPPDSV